MFLISIETCRQNNTFFFSIKYGGLKNTFLVVAFKFIIFNNALLKLSLLVTSVLVIYFHLSFWAAGLSLAFFSIARIDFLYFPFNHLKKRNESRNSMIRKTNAQKNMTKYVSGPLIAVWVLNWVASEFNAACVCAFMVAMLAAADLSIWLQAASMFAVVSSRKFFL